MNFKTKRKNLEENLFADMVVLAGAYIRERQRSVIFVDRRG